MGALESIKSAIQAIGVDIKSLTNGKQDKLTFDATPTSSSSNPVTSAGIAAAIAAATAVQRGAGMPNGVVTPPALGSLYVDTNATCGAILWFATGTTSTSWSVLCGDTGWRNITALQTDVTVTSGRLHVRRINETVWLFWESFTFSGSYGARIKIPSGFTPDRKAIYLGQLNATRGSTATTLRVLADGANGLNPFDISSTALDVKDTTQHLTPDAWPTSAPGTPTS